jgi:hypothetical protein
MQRDAMMPLGVRLGVFDGEEVSAVTLMKCAQR